MTQSAKPTVLAIDDNAEILRGIRGALTSNGYEVDTAQDVFEAQQKMDDQIYDLLLVDIAMPLADGLTFVEQTMKTHSNAGIIIISGQAGTPELIRMIRLKVDDVLLKPFDKQELQQIVGQTLMRRRTYRAPSVTQNELVVGPLYMNIEMRKVRWYSEDLSLTPTEFCILQTLAQSVGQYTAPAVIMQRCRNYVESDDEAAYLLKPHIANLRSKLEGEGKHPRMIHNQRGLGFMLRFAEE